MLIYRTELIWILILLQDELFMHLTNYSINKHNDNFDRDDSDDSGSKRYVQHSDEGLALDVSFSKLTTAVNLPLSTLR